MALAGTGGATIPIAIFERTAIPVTALEGTAASVAVVEGPAISIAVLERPAAAATVVERTLPGLPVLERTAAAIPIFERAGTALTVIKGAARAVPILEGSPVPPREPAQFVPVRPALSRVEGFLAGRPLFTSSAGAVLPFGTVTTAALRPPWSAPIEIAASRSHFTAHRVAVRLAGRRIEGLLTRLALSGAEGRTTIESLIAVLPIGPAPRRCRLILAIPSFLPPFLVALLLRILERLPRIAMVPAGPPVAATRFRVFWPVTAWASLRPQRLLRRVP